MESDNDTSSSDDAPDITERPQDPLVARLRPDPSQPPKPTRSLAGLLGDSDRPGFRRLYFTAEMDYYAEFRSDDVIAVADIPPDRAPFVGEQATGITLRHDAAVDVVTTRQARPVDEFDLDVRLTSETVAQGGTLHGVPLLEDTFARCPTVLECGRWTRNPRQCFGETFMCDTFVCDTFVCGRWTRNPRQCF